MTPAETDVLLLAAGRGERLRPITDSIPKPLVKVGGKELIVWNLEVIARGGFRRVFINLHYLGEQIRDFIGDGSRFGLTVEYSDEPILLDTGGAIKNIEPRLKSDCLVTINSDILLGEDFSLSQVLAAYREDRRSPVATLVLRPDKDAERFGILRLDSSRRIVRFLDVSVPDGLTGVSEEPRIHTQSEAESEAELMYLGVQVISRQLIAGLPARGTIFSITRDVYREAIRQGKILSGTVYGGYWNDVGTADRLASASKFMESSKSVRTASA